MADKSVIVISDDETDTESESPGADCKDSSVLLLEENSDFDCSLLDENRSDEMVDAEFGLSITYSKKADVMPHARYDCTSHVFSQSDNQTSRPVGTNSDFCEQCYCYICDKLASECQSWITPSFCHCNAHKRSPFWKSWRDKALIGALIVFKFDLLEIDADLRHAESLLMKFDADLSVEYDKFMMGTVSSLAAIYSCSCCCHNQYQTMVNCKRCSSKHEDILIYNYSNVYQLVLEFLEKANGEKPKTFAVVLLGAAQRILLHKQPLGHHMPNTTVVPEAVPLLLQSLNVYLWEDSLLVSVLKGQNITGERVVKGKKETLFESIHVVLARTEKLKQQNRYRELARYLKSIRETAGLVLKELETKQIIILPKQFYSNYFPDEAMLMLVTQALVQRLLHARMCTVLNIAMAFRRNMWALKYLFKSLSVRLDVLHAFLDCLIKDLNEKNNTLLTRTVAQSDAEHIGHFIFFLISYEHAVLRPVAHKIVDFLLEHWNELQNCPWQRNLATLLQNQDVTHWNTSNSFLQLKNKLRTLV
ncbi:hypothetical protein EOD39_6163 [Acipenser ruthenus]|uniref:Uncharacterized protein n=1 Tax=Acipenser ruthenus TaxID=7906 RepID=A0A444UB54_ACIRT|nr:hypothetical protein EOD39_6163 [Acipenser ruthenus]